jgi:hypothetical protein
MLTYCFYYGRLVQPLYGWNCQKKSFFLTYKYNQSAKFSSIKTGHI